MSNNVLRFIPILKIINAVPRKVRESILKEADDDLIKAISEICLNFCRGNVKCCDKSYKKLKKYKSCIHRLALVKKSQKNLKREKQILVQNGSGFLPILLPPLITAITTYLLEK